jgi:TIGR03009 family protein
MPRRWGICFVGLGVLFCCPAMAQTRTGAGNNSGGPPAVYGPQVRPDDRGSQSPGRQVGEAAAAGRQQVPPKPIRAPFQLTREQFDDLWQVLKAWETRGAKVKTYRCQITLWEYNKAFNSKSVREGELKYKAPDKGVFKVKDAEGKSWDGHWLCDGQAVYEYNYNSKTLVQITLPPEMRGQAIAEGPLPFVFCSKAESLLDRYFLRLVTPDDKRDKEIWIEAYPRTQKDAANFQRATVILTTNLEPFALEMYLPGGNERQVYQFDNAVINEFNLISWGDPFTPTLPKGWTKVVDPGTGPPEGGRPSTPPQGGNTQSASSAARPPRPQMPKIRQ